MAHQLINADSAGSLADCIQHLITRVCTEGVHQCAELTHSLIASQCAAVPTASPFALAASNANNVSDPTDLTPDPCSAGASDTVYNQGLHIGGVFIILAASSLGAGLPVLGKYIPFFAVHPFLLVLGKCLGIGIILACALIHMLQPAAEALTNACLGTSFTVDYRAYAYLFAMFAILIMQFVDFTLEQVITGKLEDAIRLSSESDDLKQQQASSSPTHSATSSKLIQVVPFEDQASFSLSLHNDPHQQQKQYQAPLISEQERERYMNENDIEAHHTHTQHNGNSVHRTKSPFGLEMTESPRLGPQNHHLHEQHDHEHGNAHNHVHDDTQHEHQHQHGHSHGVKDAPGHGHVHSVLLLKGMKRNISAYMLEFAVTSHSIFIGLTTGIVDESGLRALLVALAFHQAFEGVALGSRIVEAELSTASQEIFMILLFAFAAPLGMGIGIGITSSINPNGATYNYTSGIFDSICAGILLYIGLVLLLKDFPEDITKYCKGNATKKYIMFSALWAGAGFMAFIGRYL